MRTPKRPRGRTGERPAEWWALGGDRRGPSRRARRVAIRRAPLPVRGVHGPTQTNQRYWRHRRDRQRRVTPIPDRAASTLATPEASTQMLAALVTSAVTAPRPRKLVVRAPGAVPASL